jgi:hypothetical protein
LLAAGLAPVVAENPEEIFSRGNRAYEQERYAEAADAYRTLIKYQIRDPRVEYNLGNAEFRLGNLGRAIVHFERARRMAPADADIRANLEYARSLCYDRVDPPEVPTVVRWLRQLQDRVGPDAQAWAALALFWCIGGVLAWGLARPGRWSAIYGWVLTGAVLSLLLVGISWWITFDRLEGTASAVVIEPAVEVLAGPGENNATLVTVHEGLEVEVRDVRPDWIQVSLPNGLSGWLRRDSVEQV